MKKILLSTLLLFGLNSLALEPTDGIKIDGKEYKNIDSMTQIIKNNWKDFSQKDYPKLNEKTTTLSKNIDISLSNKNTEIGKYINYSTSLSTLDRLAELQAQINQKNKALEDAKKARDEKLLSLSLKAIYLVRISNVGSRENVKALASKAESAITPQAVEKLNGTFIESLTIGNGSKFKEQITAKITGSMRVEKELINEYFRQSGQYVYLAKVAVSPLQGAKSGGKSSGVSDKDIFVEYIEASVGKKETLPSKILESIELVISQYKQSVESENELTLQNQQQIMGEYARVVKKTTTEISSLEDEIEETKTQLIQLYKNIGYSAKNQTVSEAKKYLASKIAELENQRIEIKNSELFLKKSTQTTESEDIDKEIAMMASSLVTNLIQTYEKIDNFSATTVLNNGEVVAQNKNQNKTTFRKIDTFWVYPAPTDGNGFDVAVVAKFKISEAVGGEVATQNSKIAQPRQTYTSPTPNESATLQKQDMGTYILPAMTLIKAGSFMMGSNENNDEKPIHKVTIPNDFYMGTYEVTFEQFDKYCEATGKSKPSDGKWGRGDRPAINVSWDDAVAYAKWLSAKSGQTYRLPTEEEWEYAARAGTTTKWSFGDDESNLKEYAWYTKTTNDEGTMPIGTKKPNPWGLYDMHGNVWEWTESCYTEDYNKGCYKNYKVFRGGSWYYFAENTRSAFRVSYTPDLRGDDLGFRLLRTK